MAQAIELLTSLDQRMRAYEHAAVLDTMGSKRQPQSEADVVPHGSESIQVISDGQNPRATVAPMEIIVRGRQMRLESAHSFSLALLTGYKYCVIYADVNLVNGVAQSAALRLTADAGGYPTLESDDPIQREYARVRAPIYRFEWDAAQTVPVPHNPQWVAKVLTPGEAFRTRSMDADATIRGSKVSDLIEEGATGYWKNAREADLARDVSDVSGQDLSDALYLCPTARMVSNEHTFADGDVGPYEEDGATVNFWQAGDEVMLELAGKDLTSAHWAIVGTFLTIDVSRSHWDFGILGIGSKWVYDIQHQRLSGFFPANSGYAFIRNDDLGRAGGQLMWLNRQKAYISPIQTDGAKWAIRFEFPTQMSHKVSRKTITPKIRITIEDADSGVSHKYQAVVHATLLIRRK